MSGRGQLDHMKRQAIGKSYLQVATQTASRGHLVLMLYEGAQTFLERALLGFELEDPAECNQTVNNNIQRAQAILDELSASLDLERGGELASQLRGLYNYLDRRLQESNMKKERQGVDEVLVRLGVLRDSWREMLRGASGGDAAAVASGAGGLLMAAG
jgi:flagellar secretion chaperone FliS